MRMLMSDGDDGHDDDDDDGLRAPSGGICVFVLDAGETVGDRGEGGYVIQYHRLHMQCPG